jgi:hypothetical protein
VTRRPRAWLAPVLLVVGAAGYAVWLATGDDGDEPHTPPAVDVRADEPVLTSPAALADASDLVIDGHVVAIEPGRAITDPTDPTAGVRTQLASVEVEAPVKGDPGDVVVVEQEATLLDGTPITVNGEAPLVVGDTGRFYLVRGDGDEFPYTALTTVEGFVPAEP